MGEHDSKLARGRNYPAYQEDYAAWLAAQIDSLREGRFEELDLENLLDEVESLGRSDFKSFVSAIRVVLLHLLKWELQEDHRTVSWLRSIKEHRRRVKRELKDSPSYKARLDDAIERAYEDARLQAAEETRFPLRKFPESCPYDWDVIMERQPLFGDDRDSVVY